MVEIKKQSAAVIQTGQRICGRKKRAVMDETELRAHQGRSVPLAQL